MPFIRLTRPLSSPVLRSGALALACAAMPTSVFAIDLDPPTLEEPRANVAAEPGAPMRPAMEPGPTEEAVRKREASAPVVAVEPVRDATPNVAERDAKSAVSFGADALRSGLAAPDASLKTGSITDAATMLDWSGEGDALGGDVDPSSSPVASSIAPKALGPLSGPRRASGYVPYVPSASNSLTVLERGRSSRNPRSSMEVLGGR